MSKIFINTDGGSRGNPGSAAIGVVFYDENESIIYSYKECIGVATNNEAEYRAIVKALKIFLKSQWYKNNIGNESKVICRLDSQLVVEQINGNYKIKKDHIQVFNNEIRDLLNQIKIKIEFVHILREKNKDADKLVNLALDEEK